MILKQKIKAEIGFYDYLMINSYYRVLISFKDGFEEVTPYDFFIVCLLICVFKSINLLFHRGTSRSSRLFEKINIGR